MTFEKVEANFHTLMDQASGTAETYFSRAIKSIDGEFGDGYSANHPELVVGFMQTAAMDFGAGVLAQQIRAGLNDLADKMRLPDNSRELGEIAQAIGAVMEVRKKEA
jgi:hypothetical protein